MSKRKLLLADDSITIQKVVNLTFADEGIEVIAFGDGDGAVENIDEIQPDIVLADVNMPGMSGYQMCELMRANERTKRIPVILLVGSFEPFDREEAERVGADRYLTKPFSSIAELVSTVNELLDAATADSQNADADIPLVTDPAVAEDFADTAEFPDTNDIDSLYKQSFIETVEFSHIDDLDIEFSDDGIDDEMIQTSYAESDIDSLANASFFAPGELDEFVENPEVSSVKYTETADVDNLRNEFGTPENAPPENLSVKENLQSKTESVNDLRFERVYDNLPPVAAPETELPESVAELSSAPTLSFEDRETEPPRPKFQFEELDLLEIPGSQATGPYAFTTDEQAAEAGSRIQIASLSPELIDIIVRKVVEKLAEKY